MKFNPSVIDLWMFCRGDGVSPVRYLLLQASKAKADKWFSGAQFWQVPSEVLAPEEGPLVGIQRVLDVHAIDATSVWVVEHTYTIYNRRFDELQLISVFAAEVAAPQEPRMTTGHSKAGWYDYEECERRLSFRGLREGLRWLKEFVSECESPGEEFRLR